MDEGYLLLYILLIIIAIIGLLLWRLRTSLLDPAAIFIMTWGLVTGFLVSGIVRVTHVMSTTSFIAASGAVIGFTVGAFLSRHRKLRAPLAPQPRRRVNIPISIGLTLVVLGAAAFIAGTRLPAILSGAFSPENWNTIREANYATSQAGITRVTGILVTFAVGAAIVAAVGLPLWPKYGPGLIPLSLIGWGIVIMNAMQSAGRFLLMFVLASTVYCWLLHRTPAGKLPSASHAWRRLPIEQRFFAVVALCAVIWFTFAIFPAIRDPGLVGNEFASIEAAHEGEVGFLTRFMVERLGWDQFATFAYGLAYLSEPIPKLTFYLDTTDLEETYALGEYSVPLVSQTQSAITGERTDFSQIRESIATHSINLGYTPNPWSTSARDFSIDFGLFGMPVAFLFLGYVARSAFVLAVLHPSPLRYIFASTMAVASGVSAAISPLIDSNMTAAMILLACAIVASGIRLSPKKSYSGP